MAALPAAASGAITVALFVVLGILVYPALLGRRLGRAAVALSTLLLAVLFAAFDRASGLSSAPVLTGIALALAPLAVGTVVHRLQRARR